MGFIIYVGRIGRCVKENMIEDLESKSLSYITI